MSNSTRRIARQLFLGLSTLFVVACYKPTPPPSAEYEPGSSPISMGHPQCPDLSGTYRLVHGSRESLLFSPYLLPPHDMDMVQLTHNSSNDWFTYRLRMDKARFVEQVSALRVSNPQAYATWRELITQWQQEKSDKRDTSVLEGKILQIGPLPERGGLLTPSLCEAMWGMVSHQVGDPVGMEADENAGSIETETRLSLSKQGALLFRYDNYRTTRFMFGSNIRTGLIKSVYAKLDLVRPEQFIWEVGEDIAPRSGSAMQQHANLPVAQAYAQQTEQLPQSVQEPSANLPAVLADVQQYAMGSLPAGGSITAFVLDKPSPQDAALWISMKGEADSNKQVSDLLRAMMQHPQIENVELVSVQRSVREKTEFEIRLKLENQTQ